MSSPNPSFSLIEGGQLSKEQAILVGILLAFVTYGFTILSFALCLRALSRCPRTRCWWISISYICLMFALIGANTILKTIGKVEAFTTYRQYPGGPAAWVRVKRFTPSGIVGTVCAMASNWLFDGFLIYRAMSTLSTRRCILVLPLMLYIGSIVTGCILVSQRIRCDESQWTAFTFGIPYFIVSGLCSLSIVLIIAARLILYRHLVQQLVGSEVQHRAPYTAILVVLVESAGLYGVFSAAFLISYTLQSNIARLIIPMLCNLRGTASFLIIFRAATQKNLDADSCTNNIGSATTIPRTHTTLSHHSQPEP